jgi:hypothetical protein
LKLKIEAFKVQGKAINNSKPIGMADVKQLVTTLFKSNNITVAASRMDMFDKFLQDEQN